MKFLLDQGYYVMTASELGLSRAQDTELLKIAGKQERVFITRDRDYGNLVFVQHAGCGVIYLRILPSNLKEVHAELKKVLEIYEEDILAKSFVVVEKNRHRFRKIE